MDLPEQPTIWPPAPDVAPPELTEAERPKLIVPEWTKYWCRYVPVFAALPYVVSVFCEADHIPNPRWSSFPAAIAAGVVVSGLLTFYKFGLMTLWEYWSRRK